MPPYTCSCCMESFTVLHSLKLSFVKCCSESAATTCISGQTNRRVIMPVWIDCPCRPWHSQSHGHMPRNECLCSRMFVSSSIQYLVLQIAVSSRLLSGQARLKSQAKLTEICSGENDIWTFLGARASLLPCQCYCTNVTPIFLSLTVDVTHS